MSRDHQQDQQLATADSTDALRQFTQARIALGRSGGSLPTKAWLDFKSAHAAARDAVHQHLEVDAIRTAVEKLGCETLAIVSGASQRSDYLLRPDLGRRLNDESRALLMDTVSRNGPCDLAMILCDGLAASAVHNTAVSLVAGLHGRLSKQGWRIAPVCVARNGRVALQDEIGALLGSKIALTLIGERPGLAAANSLGAYLVHEPKRGNTDANRNCVSNIREGGLSCEDAVEVLYRLLVEARHRRLSGVELKATLPAMSLGD